MIFVSDLHLRETIPECRKDSFFEAQTKKLSFLKKIQQEKDMPILIAGDIFDYWKPSPFLLGYAIDNLPDNIIAIAGQHDLHNHSFKQYNDTGLSVLEKAGKIKVLKENESITINDTEIFGFPYGTKIENKKSSKKYTIAMCHTLVWHKEKPFPGCQTDSATTMLKKYNYDVILTGDNHISFKIMYEGRTLVNPGSVMRMSSRQKDHKPRFYKYEKNILKKIYFDIEKDVFKQKYISPIEYNKDERMESLVMKISKRVDITIDFENNMKKYFLSNRTMKAIEQEALKAMETKQKE